MFYILTKPNTPLYKRKIKEENLKRGKKKFNVGDMLYLSLGNFSDCERKFPNKKISLVTLHFPEYIGHLRG